MSVEYEPKAPGANEKIERKDGQALGEFGISQTPSSAGRILDDKGKVLIEDTSPDEGEFGRRVEVLYSEDEAKIKSRGNASESDTWLGAFVLRQIRIALLKGVSYFVGGKKAA
jgi:hypothetical protein